MSFNIGDTFGDYQVIGILGAGGMGKVYKVRNAISDRVEAVKVLLPNLADEPQLADRFMREIKLLASLDHPNIAGLHTAFRLENQLLMVMEFVEGQTLDDRLKAGPLKPAEAAGYITQALAALGYAHERGVVHRDIKPANIIVTPSGTVKLMDFGIAKAVADRRLTATGTTIGSLYYMSPEQVKGSADLDGRSDLYSVGVTLYESVTGKPPFKGDSDYSIMAAHLEQQPVPPIEVDPTLPPALSQIILMAIQKEPANRFQTAEAFRKALGNAVKEAVPTPRPAAAPAPPQSAGLAPPEPARPANRRGLYMALGALAVLAVLAVAATQLPRWFGTRAGSPEPVAESSQPSPAAQEPAPPPQQPAAQEPTAQEPTAQAPPAQPAESRPAPARIEKSALGQTEKPPRAAAVPEEIPKPEAQAAQPVVQTPPAESAPSPELEQARERLGQLAPRANAARSSLQNLEAQQKSAGLGLRGDISASWKRMEQLLDEAQGALNRSNAAAAKKNLDAAERELDKLEKFLGM